MLDKRVWKQPTSVPFCRSCAAFIETDLIKNGAARHALDIYDKTFFSWKLLCSQDFIYLFCQAVYEEKDSFLVSGILFKIIKKNFKS